MRKQWINRFDTVINPKPVRPGVWQRRDGGHVARARIKDPRTGKEREIRRILPDATADEAYETLQAELKALRSPVQTSTPTKLRFAEYGTALIERKARTGCVHSAAYILQLQRNLKNHLIPTFGDLYMTELRRADLLAYHEHLARKVTAGHMSPRTTLTIWKNLLTIVRSFVQEFDLERDPTVKLPSFDCSTHRAYTRENPNSLKPHEVLAFLARFLDRYPGDFAMVVLGFATGLRNCSLRPLRRKGLSPDVLFDEGILLNRRSHTVGQIVMERTKIGVDQEIALPPDLMQLLRWHIDNLPLGLAQQSDLLFPNIYGRLRDPRILHMKFRKVAKDIGLGKKFSPHGMRRTNKDLLRLSGASQVVSMAISGHQTEQMHNHYSTVSEAEQRESLTKVLDLAGIGKALQMAQRGGKNGVTPCEQCPKATTASTRKTLKTRYPTRTSSENGEPSDE